MHEPGACGWRSCLTRPLSPPARSRQALLEFEFCSPAVEQVQQALGRSQGGPLPVDRQGRRALFAEWWRSGRPRLGEPGATGWGSSLDGLWAAEKQLETLLQQEQQQQQQPPMELKQTLPQPEVMLDYQLPPPPPPPSEAASAPPPPPQSLPPAVPLVQPARPMVLFPTSFKVTARPSRQLPSFARAAKRAEEPPPPPPAAGLAETPWSAWREEAVTQFQQQQQQQQQQGGEQQMMIPPPPPPSPPRPTEDDDGAAGMGAGAMAPPPPPPPGVEEEDVGVRAEEENEDGEGETADEEDIEEGGPGLFEDELDQLLQNAMDEELRSRIAMKLEARAPAFDWPFFPPVSPGACALSASLLARGVDLPAAA